MKLTELLFAVAMTVSTVAMAATVPTPFKPGERVGFFGDSISEAGNQAFYLEYLTAIRHPGAGARFENMGKSGDTSWGGAARWATEPAAKGVGRVFVMFGMNDIGSDACAERYPQAMREIVRRLQADGKEIVLLTPSPYDVWGHQPKPLERSDEKLSACAEAVRKLAGEKALPLIDLMGPMRKIYQDNPDRWFNNDRIHPDFAGHMLMASLIWSAIGEKGEFSRVELDAAGASSLEASYTPQGLPCAVDADYRKLAAVYPVASRLNTETLVVKNLASGLYELKADGASLGSFTAMDLAAGVNLAERETPNQVRSRQALETARQLARLAQDRRVFGQVLSWMAEDKIDSEDAAAVANWIKGERPKSKSFAWGGWRNRMFDTFETLYPGRHELSARADALHAQIAAVRPVAWRLSLARVTQPPIRTVESPSARAWRLPFRLGMARFTFWKTDLDRALAFMNRIDCHYMGLKEGTLDFDATADEIAAYKAKLAESFGYYRGLCDAVADAVPAAAR